MYICGDQSRRLQPLIWCDVWDFVARPLNYPALRFESFVAAQGGKVVKNISKYAWTRIVMVNNCLLEQESLKKLLQSVSW